MKSSVKIIIVGAVLFAGGILFGVGGTVISMITFNAVSPSEPGAPDILAEEISNALVTTAIGIPISMIGFGLSLGGTIAYFIEKNKPGAPDADQGTTRVD